MRRAIAAVTTLTALSACGPSLHVESLGAPGAPIRSGQTYTWRAGSGGVHGQAMTSDNPLLDEAIKAVIDRELESRGFRRTSGPSDLGLAYVAAVERRLSLVEVDDFLRYRRGTYVISSTEVREFDLGSLIIDVTDGETGELWWRGSAEAELHRDDRDYRQQKLEEGVAAILDRLPAQ